MRAIFCVILALYLFYVARSIVRGGKGDFYVGLFAFGSFIAVVCGTILAALGK